MASILSTLKERGLVHDASHFDELERLLASTKTTFYCGFDPTADSLHAGSMLPLLVMRRLQKAGHKPIVILGSATGMIGDPSGKSEERKFLSVEELQKNLRGMEKQIKLFLSDQGENRFETLFNDQWTKNLSLLEFLREVGKHFSVNAMIAKDSVRARLENREQGISYTEFSYMLLQAYDFYWLYKERNCRLQVGGSDQWGNITAGIELIRRKAGADAPQAYGLTFPLLTTSTGAKFGKSEKGAIWLDAAKTSPYHFYQYWVNTTDEDVMRFIKLFTEIDGAELQALEAAVLNKPQERLAQKALAGTLTDLIHGPEETTRALQATEVLFGGSLDSLDSKTLLDIFSEVPSTSIPTAEAAKGLAIQDLLVTCGVAQTKGAAKRLIEGGGLYVNNERITSAAEQISLSRFIDKRVLLIRSGKKSYYLAQLA